MLAASACAARPSPEAGVPQASSATATLDGFEELRNSGRLREAEQRLLAWLCPTLTPPATAAKLAGCGQPTSEDIAAGWALFGAMEVGEPTGNASLEASHENAEVAFGLALKKPSQRAPKEKVLYMRGWMRFRLGRYEGALVDFLGALDASPNGALVQECLHYAALCIAERDWDGDEKPDPKRGFARLEAVRALPKDAPYLADLYVRVVHQLIDDAERDDAVDALAAMRTRFPLDNRAAELRETIRLRLR